MYPHQAVDVSVPAQWINPTGARSADPNRVINPGPTGETHPLVHPSADQSVS